MLDDRAFGGVLRMPAEIGSAPSHWISYVAVDDVDASTKRALELGGQIHLDPKEIPHVGRFSIIADPTGGVIALITLASRTKE